MLVKQVFLWDGWRRCRDRRNLQERTRFLMYSLILSCRCIRSTLRSRYWAWMVLQWPISSTNSLDKTPCCRKTASWSLGCMFTDFTAEILPPSCKNLLPLHKNMLRWLCVWILIEQWHSMTDFSLFFPASIYKIVPKSYPPTLAG